MAFAVAVSRHNRRLFDALAYGQAAARAEELENSVIIEGEDDAGMPPMRLCFGRRDRRSDTMGSRKEYAQDGEAVLAGNVHENPDIADQQDGDDAGMPPMRLCFGRRNRRSDTMGSLKEYAQDGERVLAGDVHDELGGIDASAASPEEDLEDAAEGTASADMWH